MRSDILDKKLVVYYSLLAVPLAIIGLPLYIYLPTFYTSTVGIDITTVGILIFIARLTDVISDPIFGYLSDESVRRYNSRKPLIILGSFILVFSFYLIINPNESFSKSWLLVFSILIYMAWSMINIPYLTWSSEISKNYNHKTVLNSSRELFTILGVIIALIVPTLLEVSNEPQNTLNVLFILFLLIFVPSVFIILKKIKIQKPKINQTFNIGGLRKIYKNMPDIIYLDLSYFINNLANALPATLFLLFIEHVIEKKEYSGVILIIYFFSGLIALPFWNYLSSKIGKKTTWVISILLASSAFIFVLMLKANDIELFIVISIISGLSLGADMALPTSMKADLVQKSEKIQNNSSGLLFGIWTMITKFSLAFAIALGFIILGFFDFDSNEPNTQSLFVLTLLYGLAPVILKFLSLLLLYRYQDHNR